MKPFCVIIISIFSAFGMMAQDTPREFTYQQNNKTLHMKSYVLCLLKSGPERSQDSAQQAKLMKDHLAHFAKLSEEGKIAMVGPVDGDSELRGIIVFNVASIEEARKLEEQDPMIQANRLTMELYTWWTEKGATLP